MVSKRRDKADVGIRTGPCDEVYIKEVPPRELQEYKRQAGLRLPATNDDICPISVSIHSPCADLRLPKPLPATQIDRIWSIRRDHDPKELTFFSAALTGGLAASSLSFSFSLSLSFSDFSDSSTDGRGLLVGGGESAAAMDLGVGSTLPLPFDTTTGAGEVWRIDS